MLGTGSVPATSVCLLMLLVEVKSMSVACDEMYIACGGSCAGALLYDRRMLSCGLAGMVWPSASGTPLLIASVDSTDSLPVKAFTPWSVALQPKEVPRTFAMMLDGFRSQITHVEFSPCGGELLLNYSNNGLFLFGRNDDDHSEARYDMKTEREEH